MRFERLDTRLPGRMAEFVERVVSEGDLHRTPSDYIRHLILRDMVRKREGVPAFDDK